MTASTIISLALADGPAGPRRISDTNANRVPRSSGRTGGEAQQIGLVNAVYTQDELLQKATEMARTIAANAPLAVSASKRAILLSRDVDLTTGLAYEAQSFGLLFDSDDQKAGMTGFRDVRIPVCAASANCGWHQSPAM